MIDLIDRAMLRVIEASVAVAVVAMGVGVVALLVVCLVALLFKEPAP